MLNIDEFGEAITALAMGIGAGAISVLENALDEAP